LKSVFGLLNKPEGLIFFTRSNLNNSSQTIEEPTKKTAGFVLLKAAISGATCRTGGEAYV
jgi:hypothetical protein